jgi:hypothetical protein
MGENTHIFPVPNNYLVAAQSHEVINLLRPEGRAPELRAGYRFPLLVVVRKYYFLLLAYNLPNCDLAFFALLVTLADSYIFLFLR